jgi:hypothetical protein
MAGGPETSQPRSEGRMDGGKWKKTGRMRSRPGSGRWRSMGDTSGERSTKGRTRMR